MATESQQLIKFKRTCRQMEVDSVAKKNPPQTEEEEEDLYLKMKEL